MTQINYSFIIPHKNIPKLLQRCLNSIPRRDDIQIIVVDDNSDPDKVDFDKFPGLDDPCIEVILTKEGRGAGYARNVGLTKATGKWLLFADADDYYNYCIHDILDEYIDSIEDLIFFKNNSLNSDTYTTTRRSSHFNLYIDYWLNSPQKADGILRYKHNDTVWAKLFKNELVKKNNIFFDETSIANDNKFAYLTGYFSRSIYADPRALYCNTIRSGSIRYSEISFEKRFDLLCVDSKRYLFFHGHKIPLGKKFLFLNILIKLFFLDRTQYNKAKMFLLNLGFTKRQLFGLCIKNIIVYIFRNIINKLLPDNNFFMGFHLKKKHQKIY